MILEFIITNILKCKYNEREVNKIQNDYGVNIGSLQIIIFIAFEVFLYIILCVVFKIRVEYTLLSLFHIFIIVPITELISNLIYYIKITKLNLKIIEKNKQEYKQNKIIERHRIFNDTLKDIQNINAMEMEAIKKLHKYA